MAEIYDDKILDAVDAEAQKPEEKDTIELSTGVILKQKTVPVLRAQALISRFKYPPVPELYDEKKDRMIRNPNSPEYMQMKAEIDTERGLAVIDLAIASGTEMVHVPDHLPKLDDEEWLTELVETGVILKAPESKAGRYLAWVKYNAIGTAEDMQAIGAAAGLSFGVSERQVATSLENSFQDH